MRDEKGVTIMLKKLFSHLIDRVMHSGITAYSAQIAYYMILSFFPFLVFVSAILARTNLTTIMQLLEALDRTRAIPEPVMDLITGVFSTLQTNSSSSFSLYFIVIIYSSSHCMRGIMNGIQMAYNEVETRPLLTRFLLSFFYTICFAAAVVLFVALVLFGEQLTNMLFHFIGLDEVFQRIANFLHYPLPLIFMFITYMLLYSFIPVRRLRFRDVYIGALFATCTSFLVSRLFSLYVSNIANYATLYGSISSIIIILLWLYLISFILLLGAMLNATLDEIKGRTGGDKETQEKIPDKTPEKISDKASNKILDKAPDKIPETISDKTPDKIQD